MPDKRKHRGPSPNDDRLFASKNISVLRNAVADMSLLLSRGYAQASTLKLVGDRYKLTRRQRLAVMRCACSDDQLESRRRKQLTESDFRGGEAIIDGFNLLITVEALLSGAPVFIGRDSCRRDLSGIHGSYRKVTETPQAFHLIANKLSEMNIKKALWRFDSPVSNSGMLKTMIGQIANENGWPWVVELKLNPDKALMSASKIVITSDSNVLDQCDKWFNFTEKLENTLELAENGELNVIDLSITG